MAERDVVRLSVAFCVAIARNHPFAQGNKRTAILALDSFLGLNGLDFQPPEARTSPIS